MDREFPEREWKRKTPEDVGLSSAQLAKAKQCLLDLAEGKPFRAAIIRKGFLAAEWIHGISADKLLPLTSASKSAYSWLLGIAVAEGKVDSIDARVIDYYPEMIEVRDGEGPKPGRYAFEDNREITFRHLIGNTSGYMKPGERPGSQFHYQTFALNILTNAFATIYGLYDSKSPGRLPGCAKLLKDKVRDPIGGKWAHDYHDFEYATGSKAKSAIFGHGLQIVANTYDAARLGYLWLNLGNWNGKQVVPKEYLQQATKTNPDIVQHEPQENWKYGYGFWVNDHGNLWSGLPRDLYGAWGGGAKYIWVSPVLDLVVTLIPGPWDGIRAESDRIPRERAVLGSILDAVVI